MEIKEWFLESTRRWIVRAYSAEYNLHQGLPDDYTGGDFGELLCWEIHQNGQTFCWLARKWHISVSMLGVLIMDHCEKLEE